MRKILVFKYLITLWIGIVSLALPAYAEDGYELWLRYVPVKNVELKKSYQQQVRQLIVEGESATARITAAELQRGFAGLLEKPVAWVKKSKISKQFWRNAVVLQTK